MFLTIQDEELEDEIVVKKSKFIATLFYASSVDKVQETIKTMKKKYFDARHNCFAYRIMTENGIIERQSDDGEPSGTAGAPLLNILKKNNLCNVLVVVTRYFGGILLGTGGLVRAYSDSALKVINSANLACETNGLEVEIEISYTQLETIKHYCKKNSINIINIIYENNIKCYLEATSEELDYFLDKTKSNCQILNYRIIRNKNIRKNSTNWKNFTVTGKNFQ